MKVNRFCNYQNLVVYDYRISIGFDATIDELTIIVNNV